MEGHAIDESTFEKKIIVKILLKLPFKEENVESVKDWQ